MGKDGERFSQDLAQQFFNVGDHFWTLRCLLLVYIVIIQYYRCNIWGSPTSQVCYIDMHWESGCYTIVDYCHEWYRSDLWMRRRFVNTMPARRSPHSVNKCTKSTVLVSVLVPMIWMMPSWFNLVIQCYLHRTWTSEASLSSFGAGIWGQPASCTGEFNKLSTLG